MITTGPMLAAAAALAEQGSARAVWRTKRSTIQIEKRSTNVPAYVWIVSVLILPPTPRATPAPLRSPKMRSLGEGCTRSLRSLVLTPDRRRRHHHNPRRCNRCRGCASEAPPSSSSIVCGSRRPRRSAHTHLRPVRRGTPAEAHLSALQRRRARGGTGTAVYPGWIRFGGTEGGGEDAAVECTRALEGRVWGKEGRGSCVTSSPPGAH